MKAVILVGGFGTRLRPYTFTKAKPLVPFCNLPIVEHQIKALVAVGVKEIILAVGHMPSQMIEAMKTVETTYDVKVTFSVEDVPLGTAGPLGLCREKLLENNDPFFMLNSDVSCSFPLREMLDFHLKHKRAGTIMVTPVEDPSRFGLVVFEKDTGKIEQFLEKPAPGQKSYPSDKINAGIYLLNPSVLEKIPLPDPDPHNISIERQIFPALAAEEDLYAYTLPGYWMDVGQPKDFVTGTKLHLQSLADSPSLSSTLTKSIADSTVRGNVVVHPTATIGKNCIIGPDVVVGPNVKIADGVVVSNSTVMDNSTLAFGSVIKDSIIGWDSKIGKWAHVKRSFLGEDVQIGQEVIVNEIVVFPHKGVNGDVLSSSVIY